MIFKRRPGDVASCYASSALAERELGFKAEKSLTDMCKLASPFLNSIYSKQIDFMISLSCLIGRDMWTWQSKNPHGFSTPEKSWSLLPSLFSRGLLSLDKKERSFAHLCPLCHSLTLSNIHTGQSLTSCPDTLCVLQHSTNQRSVYIVHSLCMKIYTLS